MLYTLDSCACEGVCVGERQRERERKREIEWKAIEWNGIGWCNITLKFEYQNYIANTKLKRCGAVHPIHIVCEWCVCVCAGYVSIWYLICRICILKRYVSNFVILFFILFLCAHVSRLDGSINAVRLQTNNWGVPQMYRLNKKHIG